MILFLVVVWVVVFVIWNNNQKRKKAVQNKYTPKNYYIGYHEEKLCNDVYYEEYLKWCYVKSEIPMDKHIFIKGVEDKEKEIRNLYK